MPVYSNKTFKEDLSFGKQYEEKALKLFDYDDVVHPDGYCKEYDFVFTKNNRETRVEVKADKMAHKTGNIAIEYKSAGKPSGIATCEADYWVHYVIDYINKEETCYKFDLSELKEKLTDCRTISACSGKNRLYLLPLDNVEHNIYSITPFSMC